MPTKKQNVIIYLFSMCIFFSQKKPHLNAFKILYNAKKSKKSKSHFKRTHLNKLLFDHTVNDPLNIRTTASDLNDALT